MNEDLVLEDAADLVKDVVDGQNNKRNNVKGTSPRADYMRKYYYNNRAHVLSKRRAAYKKKSESERERYRKYYKEHRAEILARRKDRYIHILSTGKNKGDE